MKKTNVKAVIALFALAILWGVSYIGVEDALRFSWGPFPILTVRTAVGALSLLPFVITKHPFKNKRIFYYAFLCGACGFGGLSIQAFGQRLTTVSETAFLTSLYIVITPIINKLFLKKKEPWVVFASCIISVIGCLFLNLELPFSIKSENLLGNILVIIGSIFFALQIIFISKATETIDVVSLTFVELIYMCLLSLGACVLTWDFSFHIEGIQSLIWVGVLSSGLCSVLQVYGEKHVKSSIAGIIMGLESVFAVLFAIIIYKEYLTWVNYVGCALILLSVLIIGLDFKNNKNLLNKEDDH